jgi:hypothetical protein
MPTLPYYPNWVDTIWASNERLGEILREVYKAKQQKLNTLATIGIRCVLELCCNELGITENTHKTFGDKVKGLCDKKVITDKEYDYFYSKLFDAGSAAVHRGWKVNDDDLQTLLNFLGNFIETTFILNKQLDKIQIPKRP